MAAVGGFWSYVHADDEAEGGRISRLARDVIAEFELNTGEPIELFLDRDDVEWGDRWRSKIDDSLALVAFFIPVLTPRYFASAECRRELQFFAKRATDLGIRELVLPLLYVDVASLHEESPSDDLAVLVKSFQRVDWTDVRFASPDSEEYRRAVAGLASRLVKANAEAERADVAEAAAQLQALAGDGDTPGWLDRLAEAETTMPAWGETLEAIGREIEVIGQVMREGSQDIARGEAQGKGLAARLVIARRVAEGLAKPAENIYSFGNEFAAQLRSVDDGLRIMIDRVPAEVEDDPSNREKVCEFFRVISQLSANAHEGLGAIQGMIDAIAPLEAMSRDLRRPLRRLREGLTVMIEAREVTDEWVRLIDESGVDCEEAS